MRRRPSDAQRSPTRRATRSPASPAPVTDVALSPSPQTATPMVARGERPKLEARQHLHPLKAVAPARRHGRTDKRPGLCGRARQAAERARITTGISRRVFAW
jgi:hypothetical protein